MTTAKPIIIRDVEYKTRAAAAEDLGVTISAISVAVCRGTLDTVGLRAAKCRSIKIRGVEYATRADAAVALGLGVNALGSAAFRGRLDTVGTGRKGRPAAPITIRGVEYPSVAAAAEQIGCTPGAIYAARLRGTLGAVSGGRKPKPKPKTKRGRPSVPVTIRGVTYPSQTAAAGALGVSQATISNAMARGTLDGVGLGVDGTPRGREQVPVTIRGVSYPSITAAAKAHGVTVACVANARKRWALDTIGLRKARASR